MSLRDRPAARTSQSAAPSVRNGSGRPAAGGAAAPRRGLRGAPGPRLTVDPIACDGHGLCAELLPELIELDDWGYPIIADEDIPPHLLGHARRAVRLCPTLALRIERPGR